MRISLICTVKNEEKNIEQFLISLLTQTRRPDEMVVVDGGSTDRTYDIIKKIKKKYPNFQAYQIKGANISRGRNYAIEKSKSEVIAVCDAGGKYKEDWLEKLEKGFNGEVSFGIDRPLIKNDFHKALAKRILHKNVPGSSRNMIFLKKIWKDVGGYPEDMERAEDTLFDERIKCKGYHISRVSDAICFWEMREDIGAVRKQFHDYGYWDGILQKKHRLLPRRYRVLVVLLIILLPLYPIFWIISEFSLQFKIDFVRRYAYLKGYLRGYYGR